LRVLRMCHVEILRKFNEVFYAAGPDRVRVLGGRPTTLEVGDTHA
jgi:hypothetical protein